jgi:hypothetical protein
MQEHKINNHKINLSLIDDNKIKIIIINPVNNVYESITHIRDFNSIFDNQYTYSIILKCFNKEPNFLLTTAFKDDVYILKFDICMLNCEFTFLIKVERKIILSLDELETLNQQIVLKDTIHKKEIENLNQTINNLYEIIENFNEAEIKFTKSVFGKQQPVNIYLPLNSKEVVLHNINDYDKIKCLYKLERLIITTNVKTINFENKNVKTLVLIAPEIETLNGIEKFPNLELLELTSCDKLYDIKTFLYNTNIKKIIFKKCGENQKRNMISYCNAKNIELVYV